MQGLYKRFVKMWNGLGIPWIQLKSWPRILRLKRLDWNHDHESWVSKDSIQIVATTLSDFQRIDSNCDHKSFIFSRIQVIFTNPIRPRESTVVLVKCLQINLFYLPIKICGINFKRFDSWTYLMSHDTIAKKCILWIPLVRQTFSKDSIGLNLWGKHSQKIQFRFSFLIRLNT